MSDASARIVRFVSHSWSSCFFFSNYYSDTDGFNTEVYHHCHSNNCHNSNCHRDLQLQQRRYTNSCTYFTQ